MTKEEEIRANVAVGIVQGAWEHMVNMCIEAETRAQLLADRVKELEEKLNDDRA